MKRLRSISVARITRTAIAAATGVMLLCVMQSCFTGIESTPRITQKDVKRNDALVTPEKRLADSIGRAGFSDWRPGHRLLVTDNRFALLLSGNDSAEKGDTLVYDGFSPVTTVTADTATVIRFRRPDGNFAGLRIDRSPSELAADSILDIPFTVDLPMVNHARDILQGRELFVLSPMRVGRDGRQASGTRFTPVTVTDVIPGNADYPLHVIFNEGDGQESGIMMTAGPERTSTRNFDRLFSFTDPRQLYPRISDDIWAHITRSEIVADMTREEAMLAKGAPRDVKKGQDGTSFFERWTYDNGSYIFFTDGLVSSFRL